MNTVLLIDKDPRSLRAFSRTLKRLARHSDRKPQTVDFLAALGPSDGLDLIRKTPVDLVVMNIDSAGSKFVQFIAEVQLIRPQAGVCVMSGIANDPRFEACLDAGAIRTLDLPAKQTSLELLFEARDETHADAVVRALKAEARRILTERTEVHARAVGRPMPAVAITDPRARWGSCTPPRTRGFGAAAEVGRIRYSWRLVLAPPAVLDYVAAHECAHLVEANHSRKFWAVVHSINGDHRPHRDWLKAHGARLHAFGRG